MSTDFRLARSQNSRRRTWADVPIVNKGLIVVAVPLLALAISSALFFQALNNYAQSNSGGVWAWPMEEALMEIEAQAGKQFDPMVVDAFLELSRRGALAVPGVEAGRVLDRRAPWDTASL